jgi:hypothetical protein
MALCLAACAVPRAPADLRQQNAVRSYRFNQSLTATKACLIPGLDRLRPFTIPSTDTRPPSIRDIGGRTEIFAQDETITLYVVDLEPAGTTATTAGLYTATTRVTEQFDTIARGCGAI